jgi:hypothetical protein
MKHEKHPWFVRDSNPVPLGQKSGALTTELPGQLPGYQSLLKAFQRRHKTLKNPDLR